jgi:MerR family copper efflux transcriptional regulator
MSVSKLNDYLKVTEAAKYLGISSNTLRNWEASGKNTVYRNPINGCRLFKQEDLDALLAQVNQNQHTATN